MKKYIISLTEDERTQLEAMIAKGKAAARKLTRARILLKADSSSGGSAWTDAQLSQALDIDVQTVANVRRAFVEESFAVALNGQATRNHRPRKVDGECEARMIALLCGPTPEGFARWSLRLVADHLVKLEIIEQISHETVRQTMQANELKPWLKKEWCIPPEQDGEFVCHMEDILEVYQRPLDLKRPLVCLDERPYQLISETRAPQPLRSGQPRSYDYEYKREGVANIFMVFAPLLGQRWVRVTQRRTRQDWACLVRDLVDGCFAGAERIILVVDNLNIHVGGALYQAFPPAEARRLLNKLEIHYTPKHGSWLNMAEIELSVLSRQCLARRLGTKRLLASEVAAWTQTRNEGATRADWQFTTADARIRLKRLYPVILEAALSQPLTPAARLAQARAQTPRKTRRRPERASVRKTKRVTRGSASRHGIYNRIP